MNNIRIVHASDWHWGFQKLPEADLYVFTGDMQDNYLKPVKIRKKDREKARYLSQGAHGDGGWFDKDNELRMQMKANREFVKAGGFLELLGSPKAPVVAVRGNHDFVAAATLFKGTNFVHECVDNEVAVVAGLKITGHRGVPPINGSWSDEMSFPDLRDRIRAMDHTCDLYLAHYPPAGLGLDLPGHWGMPDLVNYLGYNGTKPHILHCHGHIHECGGKVVDAGNVTYSNAATTYNILEGSPETGWRDESPL